jgi:hypothetical protein
MAAVPTVVGGAGHAANHNPGRVARLALRRIGRGPREAVLEACSQRWNCAYASGFARSL